jgi:hypothetical protein
MTGVGAASTGATPGLTNTGARAALAVGAAWVVGGAATSAVADGAGGGLASNTRGSEPHASAASMPNTQTLRQFIPPWVPLGRFASTRLFGRAGAADKGHLVSAHASARVRGCLCSSGSDSPVTSSPEAPSACGRGKRIRPADHVLERIVFGGGKLCARFGSNTSGSVAGSVFVGCSVGIQVSTCDSGAQGHLEPGPVELAVNGNHFLNFTQAIKQGCWDDSGKQHYSGSTAPAVHASGRRLPS